VVFEFGDAEDEDVEDGPEIIVLEPGRAGFVVCDESTRLPGSEVVDAVLVDGTLDVPRQHRLPNLAT
jgi:hypothetical protein